MAALNAAPGALKKMVPTGGGRGVMKPGTYPQNAGGVAGAPAGATTAMRAGKVTPNGIQGGGFKGGQWQPGGGAAPNAQPPAPGMSDAGLSAALDAMKANPIAASAIRLQAPPSGGIMAGQDVPDSDMMAKKLPPQMAQGRGVVNQGGAQGVVGRGGNFQPLGQAALAKLNGGRPGGLGRGVVNTGDPQPMPSDPLQVDPAEMSTPSGPFDPGNIGQGPPGEDAQAALNVRPEILSQPGGGNAGPYGGIMGGQTPFAGGDGVRQRLRSLVGGGLKLGQPDPAVPPIPAQIPQANPGGGFRPLRAGR